MKIEAEEQRRLAREKGVGQQKLSPRTNSKLTKSTLQTIVRSLANSVGAPEVEHSNTTHVCYPVNGYTMERENSPNTSYQRWYRPRSGETGYTTNNTKITHDICGVSRLNRGT